MPAYNFQIRFEQSLRAGTKRSTFRVVRKDGKVQKVGDQVIMYTGMRTKACNYIGQSKCIGVRKAIVGEDGLCVDSLAPVSKTEADWYAQRDGFKDFAEMQSWVRDTHGLPARGHIIEW